MTGDLIIRNARMNGGSLVDIDIAGGRIAAIAAGLPLRPSCPEEDAGGALVLPGLVDGHAHLDKSLLGMGWRKNNVGPRLKDKIDNERLVKRAWNIDPNRQALRQIAASVAYGTTHILSHVDIDTDDGLAGFEGVMAAREATRDLADIQLVAFPQSGLMLRPGTLDLMDAALAMGAEWIGGLDPYGMDRDPKGHLDALFALAQKYARPIDIHLHEAGEMGLQTLDLIFERMRALGMRGNVTISHAFCLAHGDATAIDAVVDALAERDVAIMTIGSARLPVPPIRKLRARGVRVTSGSDGIRDTWKPYGTVDMLRRAMFLGERCNFCRDDEIEDAFDLFTKVAAEVMRLDGYGLAPGCAGDLVLVNASNVCEAVVDHPVRNLVVKRGQVVARDGVCLWTAP